MSAAIISGARVVVRIRKPDEYAFGCVESLQGAQGTVDKVKADYANGDEPHALVRFDEPRPPWSTHQREVTAFWFPLADLEGVAS